MAAFVAGLSRGRARRSACWASPLALPALASRAGVRVALPVAVLAGAVVAQARLAAVDATHLRARLGHAVSSPVVLLETPRPRAFGTRVATVRFAGERVLLRAGRGVRWPTQRVGAILGVRGGLEPLPHTESFLRVRGVNVQLRADALAATGRFRGGAAGVVDGIRARAQTALQTGVPPPVGALLRGMALGDDAALSNDVRDDFRASGLSHRVAASGQNVMLLAALLVLRSRPSPGWACGRGCAGPRRDRPLRPARGRAGRRSSGRG